MSVVVSVYNEEAALEEFYQTAEPIFAGLPWDYELVFVNDGSADRSAEILAGFAAKNPRVVVIEFSRNFGHEAAMIAGIDYARGDGIVCMDADLQHPPELAEDIVARFEEGYEVISMVRTENHSAGLVKNITSAGFYWFINRISDVELLENASDFFAISKNAADVLRKNYREKVRQEALLVLGQRVFGSPNLSRSQKYTVFRLCFRTGLLRLRDRTYFPGSDDPPDRLLRLPDCIQSRYRTLAHAVSRPRIRRFAFRTGCACLARSALNRHIPAQEPDRILTVPFRFRHDIARHGDGIPLMQSSGHHRLPFLAEEFHIGMAAIVVRLNRHRNTVPAVIQMMHQPCRDHKVLVIRHAPGRIRKAGNIRSQHPLRMGEDDPFQLRMELRLAILHRHTIRSIPLDGHAFTRFDDLIRQRMKRNQRKRSLRLHSGAAPETGGDPVQGTLFFHGYAEHHALYDKEIDRSEHRLSFLRLVVRKGKTQSEPVPS